MLFLKEKVKLKHNIVEAALKTDKKVVMSILAIAVFNFIFLGNEYMYDNMMMYVTDAGGVVTAQNIILGVSVAGFLLFPVISCLIGKMHNNSQHKYSYVGIFGMILMLTAGIACIWVMSGHKSYMQIFIAGSILFIIMGVMGSKEQGILTFESDKFSEYAIGTVKTDTENNPETAADKTENVQDNTEVQEEAPKTSDKNVGFYIMAACASFILCLAVMTKKLNKN